MMLTLLLALNAPVAPTTPPLTWFAEDKLKHFVTSFVVTSLLASGARAAGADRATSIAVGAGVGAAAGLYKELVDSRAGGPFSLGDLVWDAAGIGSSILVLDLAR